MFLYQRATEEILDMSTIGRRWDYDSDIGWNMQAFDSEYQDK